MTVTARRSETAPGTSLAVGYSAASALRAPALEVSIRPKDVALVLCIMVTLLTIASAIATTLASSLPERQRGLIVVLGKFNVNNELNLPAWYSSSALLAASALLAMIAYARRKLALGDAVHWAALALIFLGLSADESASLHEVLIVPLRRRLDLHGPLYFAWVLPGAAFVAAVGFAYWRFLFRLDARTRWCFAISAVVYVGGALGLEMLGGWLTETVGQQDVRYIAATTLEEFSEMVGVVLFLFSLLDYVARQRWRISVAFGCPSHHVEPPGVPR